ncbi:MAG: HAMP domain-containing histidine kinase [Chloroflexi bacterium]|nr:HAMP domain-containing histidine kinase [Chloroflexota bacterium]
MGVLARAQQLKGLNWRLCLLVSGVFVAGLVWLDYLVRRTTWTGSVEVNTLLFTLLIIAAGLFPLPVGPRIKAGVTTAPLFLAALILPPGAAALAAMVGGLVYLVGLRFKPPVMLMPWYKYFFNTGETALSTGIASWAFHLLAADNLSTFAVLVPLVLMYLVNTGLVSLVVGFQIRANAAKVWWQGTKGNGLAEVSLFSFGYLGAVSYHENPPILLALLVPVVIIYFAFSRLANTNAALEEALDKVRNLQGELLNNAKLATVGALTLDLGHQVKNPLFIVIGRLESLQRRMPAGDPHRAKVDEALQAAWRMNELTEAFLSVARQQWTKLDLAAVLDEAIGMSTTRITKVVTVDRDFAVPSLPAQGHPILLREALSNLVTNAVEAVPAGGKVVVSLERNNGNASISIQDDGPGISASQMAKIFEPFNTSKHNGMGLGLFSAKHIVEMHHGTIRVESQVGQGTRIEVLLPVTKTQEEGNGSPAPAH